MSSKFFLLIPLLFSIVFLSGCQDESEISSQVVAKVNNKEITNTEFNEYLKRVPVKTKDKGTIEQLKQKVLQGLVDQKLLLEAAEKAKVDRSAEVISAIDIAKNRIIVDAYLNKVLSGSTIPDEKEVEKFYSENDMLFNQRKRFIYDQYTLAGSPDEIDAIVSKIKLLDNANQLKAFFEQLDYKYGQTREYRTTNQLPKELVKAMLILKQGDIGYFKVLDGLVVIGVHNIESVPVTLDQAKSAVSSELSNQKRKKAIKMMVKSLKESATIEYNPVYASTVKKDEE